MKTPAIKKKDEVDSDDYGNDEIKLSIDVIKKSNNLTEELTDIQQMAVARQVISGYEIDEDSRAEWVTVINKISKIINDATATPKTFPWNNASNSKYPLIKQAAIDYASRTLPEIIKEDKIVKVKIVGGSINYKSKNTTQPQGQPMPQGINQSINQQQPNMQPQQQAQPNMEVDDGDPKIKRGKRVADFMNYQLLSSPDWEDGMDKLLQLLPIYGTVFKKTYYSETDKRIKSELCVPGRIVVNYGVQSLESARRITHKITLYKNDIIERQRRGIYNKDFDVECLNNVSVGADENLENSQSKTDYRDTDFPIDLLEQQCWMDLDDDDYAEPYIITVHKDTNKVLRIVSCIDSIERSDGEIVCIKSCQYYTDYHFIRSFDGGFYSVGFGSLLLSLNKTINSLINQLVDSGTLSNTRSGFISRGLRVKNGEFKFKLGEFKMLDAVSVGKVSDHIYEFPQHEPSQTLFKLMSLLMQVGKDLTSSTDAMRGQQPAQNVSTGTLGQLIEQGTKIFTAINKRVYRSQKKEYKKIYDLNYKYVTQKEYANVLDDVDADIKKDFDPDTCDILPVADPALSSDQQRLNRMSIIQQLQTIDRKEADRLVLQSIGLDTATIERLLPPVDPNAPPPPELEKIKAETAKLQADVANISAQATLSAQTLQLEMQKAMQANKESEARIQESVGRVWKMQNDALVNMKKMEMVKTKLSMEETIKSANIANQTMQATMSAQLQEQAQKNQQQKDLGTLAVKSAELGLKKHVIDTNKEIANKKPTEGE